ncbi:hypothetical protein HY008_00030 [Candidatus Woesebacteria bacterium]|nr:hypothetical protein [Candidatus Woesebacteria bacterium]
MKKFIVPIIILTLVILLLIGFFTIRFKQTCIKDFPGFEVKQSELANNQLETVGKKVAERWLEFYKPLRFCDASLWLSAYKINSIRTHNQEGNLYIFAVSYDVRPLITVDSWIAGNGVEENRWVKRKHTFIRVEKQDDTYKWKDRSNLY